MTTYWYIAYAFRHPGTLNWNFACDVIDYHWLQWASNTGPDSKYTDEYTLISAIEITAEQFETHKGTLQ